MNPIWKQIPSNTLHKIVTEPKSFGEWSPVTARLEHEIFFILANKMTKL